MDTKPCVKCGSTERYKSGDCKACARVREVARRQRRQNDSEAKAREAAYQAAYRLANMEKLKGYYADWRTTNSEKLKAAKAAYAAANSAREVARAVAWQKANSERRKAIALAWAKAHPETLRINAQNRRARKQGGRLSRDIADRLYEQQQGKCACCGESLEAGYHLDHIMPLALGGTNSDDNVQLLTPACNLRKGAKHPDEWRACLALGNPL